MDHIEKTFASLVSESPLFQKPSTITLTGALARTADDAKFALVQSDGSALTLESSAVKSHAVIGTSFGQSLVQVELDAEKAPREAIEQSRRATPVAGYTTGNAYVGIDHNRPGPVLQATPLPSQPVSSLGSYFSGWPRGLDYTPTPVRMSAPLSATGTTYLQDGYKRHSIGAGTDDVPFSLATPHQICADLLAYMDALAPATQG